MAASRPELWNKLTELQQAEFVYDKPLQEGRNCMTMRELLEAIVESEKAFRPLSHFGHGIDVQHIYLEAIWMSADKNLFACKWASVPDFAIVPPSLGTFGDSCMLKVTVTQDVFVPGMHALAAADAKLVDVELISDVTPTYKTLEQVAFKRGSITFKPGFDQHTRMSKEYMKIADLSGYVGQLDPTEGKNREFLRMQLLKQAVFTYDKPLREGRDYMTREELILAVEGAERHFRRYIHRSIVVYKC